MPLMPLMTVAPPVPLVRLVAGRAASALGGAALRGGLGIEPGGDAAR